MKTLLKYILAFQITYVSVSSAKAEESLNTTFTYNAIERFYIKKGEVTGIVAGCNDISEEISKRSTREYSQWLVRHDDFEDRIRTILPYVLNFERRNGTLKHFDELMHNALNNVKEGLYKESRQDRSKSCDWGLKGIHLGSFDIKTSSKDAKAINHFAAWLQKMKSTPPSKDYIDQAKRREMEREDKLKHQAKANIVANSSFEDQLLSWNVITVANWIDQPAVVGKHGALMLNSAIPPKGKIIYENKVRQCRKLGTGEKFRLQARFKAGKVLHGKYAETAQYANRIYITWFESDNCSTYPQSGGWLEPKNIAGWQDLSVDNRTPSFGAKSVEISITQNGRYSRGYKAYWDDIQFFPTEFANPASKDPNPPNSAYTLALNENYLLNGSFDEDLSSWRSYQSTWTLLGYHTPGSAKVRFESDKDGYGAGAMSQCVNIGENTTFRLSAMVKKDPQSTQEGGGRIRVTWNNKEDCSGRIKVDHNSDSFEKIQGWHELKVENLHAPEHTQSVLIELIQVILGKGDYTLYWDNVYFEAVK